MIFLLKLVSFLLLIYKLICEDGNPAWTKKFACGGGKNCLDLDPPADGCYYNRKTKIGWCYHLVDTKGSIYFSKKGGKEEKNRSTRLLQTTTSPCRSDVCNQCESACYKSDCGTPEECNTCTCFSVNFNRTDLSLDWCCPLPDNLSMLDEEPSILNLTFLFTNDTNSTANI
jgi:hypothetical protein